MRKLFKAQLTITIQVEFAKSIFQLLRARRHRALEGFLFALAMDLQYLAFDNPLVLLTNLSCYWIHGVVCVVRSIEPRLPYLTSLE